MTFITSKSQFLGKITIFAYLRRHYVMLRNIYLHFHWESLNEPLHLKCGLYLHEQIDLSHTHIRAI